MATADVRRATAAHLESLLGAVEGLGDVRVHSHLLVLDNLDSPTVLVGVDRVEQGSVPYSTRQTGLALWLVVPNVEPGAADDALDDFLDQVLEVLEQIDQLTWTAADRGTYLDVFPAYRITANTEET